MRQFDCQKIESLVEELRGKYPDLKISLEFSGDGVSEQCLLFFWGELKSWGFAFDNRAVELLGTEDLFRSYLPGEIQRYVYGENL